MSNAVVRGFSVGWKMLVPFMYGACLGTGTVAAVGQAVMGQGEPLSGGAGWVGAGLLGLVLFWLLFKHLPEKDKQIRDLIHDKDQQIKEMGSEQSAQIKAVIENCDEMSRRERDSGERRYQDAMEWLKRIHESARETVHAVRNMHAALSARTHLADAFQSAQVAAWTKRLDGTVTSWNQAAERLLGWSQGEIVGRNVYRTFIPADRHQEEREAMEKIGNGETLEEYESERISRSGKRVRLVMLISPIRDQTGKVIGASAIAREAE